MFSLKEFEALKKYIQSGRSVLVLLNEGGENKLGTNINYLLEQFGMSVNTDSVVRTAFYKYFHPKEAYVNNGNLSDDFTRMSRGMSNSNQKEGPNGFAAKYADKEQEKSKRGKEGDGLNFVYAYGATLQCKKPAYPLLSTGPVCYPTNRPIVGAFEDPSSGGRLVVSGSVRMFEDDFLDKEENLKVLDGMLKFLTKPDEAQINDNPGREDKISDYHRTPTTALMSENLRSCLQESADLPKDFTKLFSQNLFEFDTDLVPEAIQLYKDLEVKHEHLTLIPPTFETPMPGLQAAVFPPSLKELDPPALDLFDLDEQFANEKIRLSQLTNKCNDDDVDYYVKSCGDVMGVSGNVQDSSNPKEILYYVFKEICKFKNTGF